MQVKSILEKNHPVDICLVIDSIDFDKTERIKHSLLEILPIKSNVMVFPVDHQKVESFPKNDNQQAKAVKNSAQACSSYSNLLEVLYEYYFVVYIVRCT